MSWGCDGPRSVSNQRISAMGGPGYRPEPPMALIVNLKQISSAYFSPPSFRRFSNASAYFPAAAVGLPRRIRRDWR